MNVERDGHKQTVVLVHDIFPVEPRITSYNVCYTKLLRPGCRWDEQRVAVRPTAEPHPLLVFKRVIKSPERCQHRQKNVNVIGERHHIDEPEPAVEPRITSYNVCYTKLLRAFCLKTTRRINGKPSSID